MKHNHGVAMAMCVLGLGACTQGDVGTAREAATGQVKSQLRGYDLGPPFPAGLRDSGLVNGYAEGEWVPFVAVIEGRKLEVADGLVGGEGDGRYGVSLIMPTYSMRNDANGISDFAVTGTYGQGTITPIPSPFDDTWLVDHGYSPFTLGAWSDDALVDDAPVIASIFQRSGPTRFGGQVSSVAIAIELDAPADATAVEVRFAVRLAPPDLEPIAPGHGAFPNTSPGTTAGAASFHPGPGPIFVGYQVGDPTGIATVPIRVDRNRCEDDDDCPPGDYCDGGGECVDPCVDDAACPADEICEDGVCQPPPPSCDDDDDCGDDVCVGGYCVPECPETCGDPEFCDRDPCVPPDGTPPCVIDDHCAGAEVCEDGVCQPPEPPCDVSCPGDDVCLGDRCVPPDQPCTDDPDCPGGEVCLEGVCEPGQPPCTGADCGTCTDDGDCPGGYACADGFCVPVQPPLPCVDDTTCPAGQTCEGGYCEPPPPPCGPNGECGPGELCETDSGTCVPEHPPLPCSLDLDCPTGETCVGDYCTPNPPGECRNDNQCGGDDVCGGGYCQPPTRPCTDDSECGDDTCTGGFCVPPHPPIPCTDAAECPAGDECLGGYCEPPGGCTVDADCPGGELCENGTCRPGQPPVPCVLTDDCPPTDDDVYVPVCYGGFCRPGTGTCTDDVDCPGGDVCAEGVCVPGDPPATCATDFDCDGGQTCESGVCQPGGDVDECVTGDDCPPNPSDDVGPACVGGLCSNSRGAPSPCGAGQTCAPGTACTGDVCAPIEGACQLDGDCREGLTCVTGWCGQACAAASECASGVCALGRCADPCADYAACATGEACLEGGCVPLAAAVGRTGGDPASWEPDVPGASSGDVKGGCDAGSGGTGSAMVLVLAALALVVGRRRSPVLALVVGVGLSVGACGSADEAGGAAGVPDAGASGESGSVDASPSSSGADDDGGAATDAPYNLVGCDDGAYDGDAGAGDGDAGAGGAAAGDPCCNPDGTCAGANACIEGPDADRQCRPYCFEDADCEGGRCADFGGVGVCIPASTEGLPCAPELCDSETICVGSSADDAVCQRRCTTADDCDDGWACTQLLESDVRACLEPSY